MKIDSWKKSMLYAVIHSLIIVLVYVCFCYIVYALVDGQHFTGKDPTKEVINGISFMGVKIVGVSLSAVISLLLLRYTHIKYVSVYIVIRFLVYAGLCCLIFFGMVVAFEKFGNLDNFPLNTFDAIYYAIAIFPLGSVIGIIVSVAINIIRKRLNARRDT